MTEAEALEKKQHKSSNGNVLPEAPREDVFDHTYKEKEGPKPARIIVWKNVILMTLLHIGAVYAMFLIPSASSLTLLWCKYKSYLLTAFLHGRIVAFCRFIPIAEYIVFYLNHSCYVSSPAHFLTTGACIDLCVLLSVRWMLWDYRSGIHQQRLNVTSCI